VMKRTGRVARATARALPPTILSGGGFLLFGAVDVLRRGTQPAVVITIGLALTAVVFLTYFILGLARYPANAGGTTRAPWVRLARCSLRRHCCWSCRLSHASKLTRAMALNVAYNPVERSTSKRGVA